MEYKIGIIGLGYVGLQLAVEFGKKYLTLGYDKSSDKIYNLENFDDTTNELSSSRLKSAKLLKYSNNIIDLKNCNFIIVAVPTPINKSKKPDLTLLKKACKEIGQIIKKNTTVVFESTVYPGTTEEVCIPIIEMYSTMKWKKDFYVGYSPERINPGDKTKTLCDIDKVVAGDTNKTTQKIFELYSTIVNKKIHKATSIKTAEMAKVLENTQRDLNIALINETAILCDKLGINTKEVIDSAKTKWNFMPFQPGLVGGHCIGVDPYYLTFKAEKIGYKPKVILAGRKLNDSVSKFITKKVINFSKNVSSNRRINILGITFKENCSDIRNSKVCDIIKELKDNNFQIKVHDPIANKKDVKNAYGIDLSDWNELYDDAAVLVFAVSHTFYKKLSLDSISKKINKKGTIYDIKSFFNKKNFEKMNLIYKSF